MDGCQCTSQPNIWYTTEQGDKLTHSIATAHRSRSTARIAKTVYRGPSSGRSTKLRSVMHLLLDLSPPSLSSWIDLVRRMQNPHHRDSTQDLSRRPNVARADILHSHRITSAVHVPSPHSKLSWRRSAWIMVGIKSLRTSLTTEWNRKSTIFYQHICLSLSANPSLPADRSSALIYCYSMAADEKCKCWKVMTPYTSGLPPRMSLISWSQR